MPKMSLQLVVMGVSGCGKSTFAQALGQALNLSFVDGDDLHAPQSIAKMNAGIALEDEDRWPWLDRVGEYLSKPLDENEKHSGRVVACSALKLTYRERIRSQVPAVRFVFLDGAPDLIRSRMAARTAHFMQLDLLDSQLRTLERPTANEQNVITVDIVHPIDHLLRQVTQAMRG